jgi:replicative DNA helicase
LITLKAELESEGLFERVGGGELLGDIAGNVCPDVNALHFAREITRLSESRRIHKAAYEIIAKPDPAVGDLERALEQARSNAYVKSYAEKSAKSIEDYRKKLRVREPRIKTGFPKLDRFTGGGFIVPSVATVGAYPSVGKTALALNIALEQDGPVVFFSLEMSNRMIYDRIASAQLQINYGHFISQTLSDKQYYMLEAYTEVLLDRGIHVFDDTYYIERQANIIAAIKPALVIVDYVQKVKTHAKTDGRRLEVAYVSGLYKQIAKDNNCVVLLLSQLARPREMGRPERFKPTMINLKEASELEADSDYVAILHRPYVLCKDNPGEVKAEDGYILLDKNKFGHTGLIDLVFNGKYQRFREASSTDIPKGFIAGNMPDDAINPFEPGQEANGQHVPGI